MSKRYLFTGLGMLILVAALGISGLAQPRTGMPGGPGSSGGPGPGMMGPGYGPILPAAGPMRTLEAAAARASEVLTTAGSTDLMAVHVMEFSNHFYVLVKEKSTRIGALELIVERNGFVRPEPGPNMMWNTKYGHMAWGMMGAGMMGYGYGTGPQGWDQTTQPSIAIAGARQIATQYLSSAFPGTTPDAGTAFYGYFTFDVEHNGKPFGMLSVNAYTGEVWYHTWHGTFVQEKEF